MSWRQCNAPRTGEGKGPACRSAASTAVSPQVAFHHRPPPSAAFNATHWLRAGTESLLLLTHHSMLAGG